MKTSEKFLRCCILGTIGGVLMAVGDWLLDCAFESVNETRENRQYEIQRFLFLDVQKPDEKGSGREIRQGICR